ncbi:MAG: hypothetical protein Q4C46_00050 [Bacillota bacterium]|nr:hypothetical protein [Bacillota bacterium]
MQIKKSFRKTILRCLMVFLAVAVTVTMTPVGMDEAYAETTLTTEKPEILVSGTAVIGFNGGVYTKENVSCEKAYTREELEKMDTLESVQYSRLKTVELEGSPVKYENDIVVGSGVKISSLLSSQRTCLNLQNDIVKFVSSDGRTVAFFPNLNDADDSDADMIIATGLSAQRYYYPKLSAGIAEERTEVEAILAWNVKKPLQLMIGQLEINDQNSPLFNKSINKIIGGEELTKAELTVDGKGYTRGDILLMERTIRSDEKDTVRGVSLNELLKDYDDSTKVKFKTADGKEQEITKGELVKGNSVLAYEIKTEVAARATTNSVMYVGIYDPKDNNYGLFRLYSDNQNEPLKMVNAIEIVKEDSGAATDNPPAVDNTEENASDDNNDNNADTEDKPDTSAKTGDEMPIGLLAGVLAAAAAGIFGTLCIRRKTN